MYIHVWKFNNYTKIQGSVEVGWKITQVALINLLIYTVILFFCPKLVILALNSTILDAPRRNRE